MPRFIRWISQGEKSSGFWMDFGARFLAPFFASQNADHQVFIGTYITYTAPYLVGGLKV